ncbi:NAD(P)-dependent dehydrogenase, short-chain alcohol dehydrogenase family [Nonomuraea solani]|uniref:NAD(P)-dependent dehydrogenase, short-chain alcohol dehydrogenase family n=1 Tax=Nonomuraea solani TaxID=1144553 RepID=A0A1H6EGJ9_9ACTN|nr:short chain dehydrogenase [Nonomuraea solani]SEG96937.1 NAD(P)-dependent dehydrogenase, short-chain alcohol dehydrogenase family [Nonomuraea solani]
MRILLIGATGTIGRAVGDLLGERHDLVRASRRGPYQVDLTDPASIDAMFTEVGTVDAVVCCAASGAMSALTGPAFWTGLDGKLLGQVNLVRQALPHVRDGGSITITSGRFAEPVPGSSLGFLVNAGLEAFVRAAATELPRGLRLNAVSPGWVSETLTGLGMDPADGTPAADVARLYSESVEGTASGRTWTSSPPTPGPSTSGSSRMSRP